MIMLIFLFMSLIAIADAGYCTCAIIGDQYKGVCEQHLSSFNGFLDKKVCSNSLDASVEGEISIAEDDLLNKYGVTMTTPCEQELVAFYCAIHARTCGEGAEGSLCAASCSAEFAHFPSCSKLSSSWQAPICPVSLDNDRSCWVVGSEVVNGGNDARSEGELGALDLVLISIGVCLCCLIVFGAFGGLVYFLMGENSAGEEHAEGGSNRGGGGSGGGGSGGVGRRRPSRSSSAAHLSRVNSRLIMTQQAEKRARKDSLSARSFPSPVALPGTSLNSSHAAAAPPPSSSSPPSPFLVGSYGPTQHARASNVITAPAPSAYDRVSNVTESNLNSAHVGPWACPLPVKCGMRLPSLQALAEHCLKQHFFVCCECECRYAEPGDMLRHFNLRHGKKGPTPLSFSCAFCHSNEFQCKGSPQPLCDHYAQAHFDAFGCPYCPSKYPTISDLQIHYDKRHKK